MALQKPFKMDSGLTSVFQALEGVDGLGPRDRDLERRKAVVVGGGTGSPVSIRSLLSLGYETSSVVAMADDGGSTGLLRDAADVTPPGDIRKCIAAFAEDPSNPWAKAFKYRLNIANGHSLGNLMLSVLEDTCGSFPEAIELCEGLVGAQGHVHPSTLDHVRLCATTNDGQVIEGQALACHSATALSEVGLDGDDGDIVAYGPAVEALRAADLIVFGPGSLFTSIIPNILVPGIVDAVRDSNATTLFVCSVADNQGETWGLTASEHVDALLGHGLDGLLDFVLLNGPGRKEEADERPNVRAVYVDPKEIEKIQHKGPMVVMRDLVDPERPSWHSPSALRDALQHIAKLGEARSRIIK